MDRTGAVVCRTWRPNCPEKGGPMEEKRHEELVAEPQMEVPAILEEVVIEELAVDGICGIY